MRRQHDQSIFWSFLQWRRFILVGHTVIFHQVLFLVVPWLPEWLIPYGLFRLMGILDFLFSTNQDIDKVNLDKLFIKGWLEWYSEKHWRFPRQE